MFTIIILIFFFFQVDSLSPPLLFGLVGFYHVPLSAEYFSVFSSCLGCCVWGDLSVCWKFVVPLYCGVSPLWVGLEEWLVKVFWLGRLVLGFWWVELDLFSLECNEVSRSEFWGVYGFGVTFGHLYFCAQGYVPFFVGELAWYVFSETCWLLGGSWFQGRYGGSWMSSCQLTFPGVRSFLVFSSFGFKPPASGFQLYSYRSLKTSPSIQHWW